jgi:hypothetical protein
MVAASSDFDIFNLFDTDDIELSQLCEKMDTENNSCKLFGLRGHDEHYELECDQFTVGSVQKMSYLLDSSELSFYFSVQDLLVLLCKFWENVQ